MYHLLIHLPCELIDVEFGVSGCDPLMAGDVPSRDLNGDLTPRNGVCFPGDLLDNGDAVLLCLGVDVLMGVACFLGDVLGDLVGVVLSDGDISLGFLR